MALFATVGWGLVPITQKLYEMYADVTGRGLREAENEEAEPGVGAGAPAKKSKIREAYEVITPWDDEKLADRITGKEKSPDEIEKREKRKMLQFKNTKLFQVVDHASQASQIGLSVIVVDIVTLITRMMGYNPWTIMDVEGLSLSRIFSKVAYSGWITLRLSSLKRYFLKKTFGKYEGNHYLYGLADYPTILCKSHTALIFSFL